MTICWRADDGPLIVVFGSSHQLKNCVKAGPPLTKIDPHMSYILVGVEISSSRSSLALCATAVTVHMRGLAEPLLNRLCHKYEVARMLYKEAFYDISRYLSISLSPRQHLSLSL